MTAKPTFWISMQKWMNLTLEQHRNLEVYCREMGYELGIDLIGDRSNECAQQADFQKDKDESKETAGGPGA